MRFTFLALFVTLFFHLPAGADVTDPIPLENVNTERQGAFALRAVDLAEVDVLYRFFEQGMWRSDGTAAGTERLDIPVIRHVLAVTADRERFYYASDDTVSDVALGNTALFVSDGSEAGTRRLTQTGSVLSGFEGFHYLDTTTGLFYFQKSTDTDRELWVTDGTETGTRRLAGGFEQVTFGGRAGGGVVFAVSYPNFDSELWRTDGTVGGTRLVDPVDVNSPFFVQLDDQVVFSAHDDILGGEPWITDGTEAGTHLLAEINPGTVDYSWAEAVRSGDLAYVVQTASTENGGTRRDLVVTDGTAAGTRILTRSNSLGITPANLVPFGDHSLAFRHERGSSTGIEPWVSDGTVAGTRLLADLEPGDDQTIPLILGGFEGGFFIEPRGLNPAFGIELYFSDGTAEGTIPLEVCVGPCSSLPTLMGQDGARIYFTARDETSDEELYVSDGGAPPVALTDFPNRRPFSDSGTIGEQGAVAGGLLYFSAVTEDGVALYRTDGTPGGLERLLSVDDEIASMDLSSLPSGFSEIGGDLYFTATDGSTGFLLYRKRGDAPSEPLDVLVPGFTPNSGNRPSEIFEVNGRLVIHHSITSGVWVSDGTAGSAEKLQIPIVLGAFPVGNRVVIWTPNQMWSTDGTSAGTVQVAGAPVTAPVSRTQPAYLGDRLSFVVSDDLWLTDGTPTGTFEAVPLGPQPPPRQLTTVGGNRVFFTIDSTGNDDLLMVSDGTPRGTRVAAPTGEDVYQLLGDADGRLIYATFDDAGVGTLFSTAGTPASVLRLLGGVPSGALPSQALSRDIEDRPRTARLGDELWIASNPVIRTDGTPAGTRFTYLLPSSRQQPRGLYEIPGHLLYAVPAFADEDNGGRNFDADFALWVTDGTRRGTREVERFDQLGTQLFVEGTRVYFGADGPTPVDEGSEPWSLTVLTTTPPPAPPASSVPAAPIALRADGEVGAVILRWRDVADNETRYVVQAAEWAFGEYRTVAVLPADSTSVRLDDSVVLDLDLDTANRFRVRAENDEEVSTWTETAGVAATPIDCDTTSLALCLQDDRMAVRVYWYSELNLTEGRGVPLPFSGSEDSGAFWFFDPDNVELVVKVLDGRPVNGHFWTFFGALSDVEYLVVVTDLEAGEAVSYRNPEGEICGQADNMTFPRPETPDNARFAAPAPAKPRPAFLDYGLTSCVAGDDALCLNEERFRVTVTWRDQRSENSGVGRAIPGTDDSGYFWFFDEANVELVVKVLDGRPVNGSFWVFYGALTDVEYTLTVTDTVTGAEREYRNEPGNICGDADTSAFPQ